MPDASRTDLDSDDERRGWSAGRFAAAVGGAGGVAGIVTLLLVSTNSTTLQTAQAAALLIAGVINLWRIAVHVFLGDYLAHSAPLFRNPWKATASEQLNTLMVTAMAITAAWIGGSLAWLEDPGFISGWRIAAVGALFAAFVAVTLAIADRAREAERPSGTTSFGEWRVGAWLLRLCDAGKRFWPVKALGWLGDGADEDDPEGIGTSRLALALFCGVAVTLLGGLYADWARGRPGALLKMARQIDKDLRGGSEKGGLTQSEDDADPPSESEAQDETEPDAPAPEPSPTRAELSTGNPEFAKACTKGIQPGEGAPSSFAWKLHALWWGGEEASGFGWDVVGCPLHARPVPGRTDVWYQPSMCGGELRGLAVAADGDAPAMLFQQAARFGRELALDGQLRGAWPRVNLAGGDLYVLDAELEDGREGSYVLVRAAKTAGVAGPSKAGVGACRKLPDTNAEYTVVVPGLLPHWQRTVATDGWVWPDDGGHHFPDGDRIEFRRFAESDALAHATCSGPADCTLRLGDSSYESDGGIVTKPNEIIGLWGEAMTP